MAQYYAVERSSEYLAHYGVRGMKWGVRRAIAKGDTRALGNQYRKAAMKLGKLSIKANQGLMKKRYSDAKKLMAVGAAGSAALSGGLSAAMSRGPLNARLINGAVGAATGGLTGALINSRGITSGRYASNRGHAKAIAKRNQWRRDMEEAFKGTQYGGKEQRKFHQQITAISDSKDPKAYVARQRKKAAREAVQLRRRHIG